MEYCSDKTLKDLLESPHRDLDLQKSFGFFRQIVKGVNFIHKNKVIHRDLKPSNIFIFKGKTIKIGDFGLARLPFALEEENQKVEGQAPSFNQSLSSGVGTPMYIAPEQQNNRQYDQKVDIYALGLIFLEMTLNFKTVHERVLAFKTINEKRELPAALNKPELSLQRTLIEKMLSLQPTSRPTAIEIIKSDEYRKLEQLYPHSTDEDDE
jgi:translation initiation factor 2-alpha kinase 4